MRKVIWKNKTARCVSIWDGEIHLCYYDKPDGYCGTSGSIQLYSSGWSLISEASRGTIYADGDAYIQCAVEFGEMQIEVIYP